MENYINNYILAQEIRISLNIRTTIILRSKDILCFSFTQTTKLLNYMQSYSFSFSLYIYHSKSVFIQHSKYCSQGNSTIW